MAEYTLNQLFEKNPLPMWIYDLETLGFMVVNAAAVDHYGYSRDEFLGMTLVDIRPPEDVDALLENIAQVDDQLDRAGTWRHLKQDGSLIYVEITSYPIDYADRRCELVIAYDVSRQVENELRLAQLLELERIVASISRSLYQGDDLDAVIGRVLGEIGQFTSACRAYLFQFLPAHQLMNNTHEWCAKGVEPAIEQLQNLPMSHFDWSVSKLKQGEILQIENVAELPAEATNERLALDSQNIQSLIMVPLRIGDEVMGFIGFDNVVSDEPWQESATRLLEITAELFGAALKRKQDERSLILSKHQLDSIIQSAQHFVFYRISVNLNEPHRGEVDFVSHSIADIVGIEPTAPFSTWFERIHPDDAEMMQQANQQAAEQATSLDCVVRMLHPQHNEWRWIRVVSNPVHDHNGQLIYFNGLLLDVSDNYRAQQSIQDERDFANAVTETVGALIVVLDCNGKIVRFNRACEVSTGFSSEEVIGRNVWDLLIVPEQVEAVKGVFRSIQATPQQSQYENFWLCKDGSRILIEWSNTAIIDEAGQMVFAIATGIDITQKRAAEATIHKLSSAVEQSANGIVILDHDGLVEYVNPAFANMRQKAADQLIGRPLGLLGLRQAHDPGSDAAWSTLERGETWRGEYEQPGSQGQSCWVSLTVFPISTSSSEISHYTVLAEDITRLRRARENLRHMATYDVLTELPNRRLFMEFATEALKAVQEQRRRVVLLYLDLDNFKRINDSLGHEAGDALLKEIAQRLKSITRHEDLVARLGGDEFIIMVEIADQSFDPATLARKALDVIKQPITVGQTEVVVTACVGLSQAPGDATEVGTLLKNADLAMYQIKGRERDAYRFFEHQMNIQVAQRMTLESELRLAFKSQQLEPYFQPIVHLQDRRLVGFEALARWRHPQRGFISPEEFIPVAEDSGLILMIGASLMQQSIDAVLQMRQTIDPELFIAVNLSARQTQDQRLPETVGSMLQAGELPAEALHLELTESLLMEDLADARTLLEALRQGLGANVSIDDFGTGYSSLSYLKALPIDTLKIDRSFVRDIPQDANDMAITEAVIAMAHALDLKVVAEGIETREQYEFLLSLGCDYGQGYYMAKPAPVDHWLANAGVLEFD